MNGVSHPLSAERSKRRKRLARRDKPDFCYSDQQNQEADIPEYFGPWNETEDSRYFNNNYYDDGLLPPLEELEEMIEQEDKRKCNY